MKIISKALAAIAMIAAVGTTANAQILYKVEKTGSDKTSYLLGTHHFASLSVIDSIEDLPAIMKSIDKLYGELDMEKMNSPETMMTMQKYIMAPADSTLDKIYTPEQLDLIGKCMSEFAGQPIPLQMMYGMKPGILSTQMAQLISARVFPDLNPTEGIDATMQTRARELGKPVAGLETFDFQLEMLYNRPISEQAKDLMDVVNDPKEQEDAALKLANCYKNYDIKGLLEVMLETENKDPEAAERLIYSRNDNWIKQLSAEMPEESIMVVVGAGHLPGERGVIAGLEKAGFTVTPIK